MMETMSDMPMFAVAMPTYNAESTVSEAIESVLAQSCSDWELSIVDDGSVDGTLAIAQSYAAKDPRIHAVHQENAGCGPARARSVSLSMGEFIVHFDNDDVLLPGCLERYRAFIADQPAFDIYSCNGEWFSADGASGPYFDEPGLEHTRSFSLAEMLERNLILSAAATVRRTAYDRVGGIRNEAPVEDYDLWLRVLVHGGRHVYLPEVLVRYRRSAKQMSSGAAKMFHGNASVLRHLAADPGLDPAMRNRAFLCASQYEAEAAALDATPLRESFEQRLMDGDYHHAHAGFVATRHAYRSRAKYLLGLAIVHLSPRMYAFFLRRRTRRAPDA